MDTVADASSRSTRLPVDMPEMMPRGWPRILLVAYLVSVGGVAIVVACGSLLVHR